MQHGQELYSADVETAFLHCELPKRIYIECYKHAKLLLGEDIIFDDDVRLHLKKSVYGLKTSSKSFYNKMTKALTDIGFEQTNGGDRCIYSRATGPDGKVIRGYDINEKRPGVKVLQALTYVDDLACSAPDEESFDALIKELSATFKIESDGLLTDFIGLEVDRDDDGSIKLCHKSKIKKIVASCLDHLPRKIASTPLKPGTLFPKVVDEDEPDATEEELKLVRDVDYRGIIGSVLHCYVMCRPDIGFALSQLSRHVRDPKARHVEGLMHLVSYLGATSDLGPKYSKCAENRVNCYVDASYAEDETTRRSTTGFVIMINGGAVAWMSKRQAVVSLSSTEAELTALRDICAEIIALKRDLELLDPMLANMTWPVAEDNQAAKLMVETLTRYETRKHYAIRVCWLTECWERGVFQLYYISTKEQTSDCLTKCLDKAGVVKHRETMFNLNQLAGVLRCKDELDWRMFMGY